MPHGFISYSMPEKYITHRFRVKDEIEREGEKVRDKDRKGLL